MKGIKMEKKLLVSQIEEKLFDYILNEPIKVGEKIPNEFELAELFGVSRSTIREAVKALVSKGILKVCRGSGTYVISTYSMEDDPLGLSKFQDKFKLALELFEVRLMLEPEIAAIAAERASKEDKERILQLCDEVENLYLSGRDHVRRDIDYHTYIAHCSQNRVVEILIPIINTAVMMFANLTERLLQKETIETHRAITNAILHSDAVGARCAMVMHLTYNRQKLLEIQQEKESLNIDIWDNTSDDKE